MMTLWKTTILTIYLQTSIVQCFSEILISGRCTETLDSPIDYEEVQPPSILNEYGDFQPLPRQYVPEKAKYRVTCSYINTTNGPLPQDFYHGCASCQKILTVTDSFIPIIPPSTFINYPTTIILNLRRCGIENILPGAFNVLTSLEELDLSENNITFIADGIFNSLIKLRVLDLSNNDVQNISRHAFSGALHLETLNLSSNSLKYFDGYSLAHAMYLTKLDASFNEITQFDFSSVRVKDLNLSNNQIDSVSGCFGAFERLNLSNNFLTSLQSVTCVNNVSDIVSLDLGHNLLSTLETIPNLNNLKYLYLQNNKIHVIPIDFFSQLDHLTFLNLSSNELDQFQYGLFDRLFTLYTLDVSNNHLTEFKKFNYHLLKQLRTLYLSDNEISTLDSKDMVHSLEYLNVISLSGNNFTCDVLVNIFHDLKKIFILSGDIFHTSNIHGIPCSENWSDVSSDVSAESNTTLDEFLRIKFNKMFNSDFTKSSMYNYFNRDFKKSNFYKSLENFKLVGNLSVSSYDSNNVKRLHTFEEQFNKSVIEYFNKDFRNSNFVKYLEEFKSNGDFLKSGATESAMYNYFNKDFSNSNFYKYLEALRKPQFAVKYYSDTNNTKAEKLIRSFDYTNERNDNSALLVVITIMLILIFCIMLSFMYVGYSRFWQKYNLKNEQVELMQT